MLLVSSTAASRVEVAQYYEQHCSVILSLTCSRSLSTGVLHPLSSVASPAPQCIQHRSFWDVCVMASVFCAFRSRAGGSDSRVLVTYSVAMFLYWG